MNSSELRETITIIFRFGAGALFTYGCYTLGAPWQMTLGLFAGAVALSVASIWTEPPVSIRTPRGGPMIDPEHTIVVEERAPKRSNEA